MNGEIRKVLFACANFAAKEHKEHKEKTFSLHALCTGVRPNFRAARGFSGARHSGQQRVWGGGQSPDGSVRAGTKKPLRPGVPRAVGGGLAAL
jgi:hypothetical protein